MTETQGTPGPDLPRIDKCHGPVTFCSRTHHPPTLATRPLSRKRPKMANPDHLAILRQGVDAWNAWRKPDITPDLSGANLLDADLRGADLMEADLSRADLCGANLRGANLLGAALIEANLFDADLRGANLMEAHLVGASLVDADIRNADLTGCRIYGVSAWGLKLSDQTSQRDLIITRRDEPEITVD